VPDPNDSHRTETYWLTSVLPDVDTSDAYAIENDIITADELLERWGTFEPYELALAINDEIRCRKKSQHYSFPITYLLYKSRRDQDQDKLVHFLRFSYEPFPFHYAWKGDTLSFDFSGIVFKKMDVINFEHQKPMLLLQRDTNAPKPYNHLAVLREKFPVSNPIADTSPSPANTEKLPLGPVGGNGATSEAEPVPAEPIVKPKKDMSNPNTKRLEKSEGRWKDQFSLAVTLTKFSLERYAETGKPVTKREYKAMLVREKLPALMVEAETIFRKVMPQEILDRGDKSD